MSIPVGDGLLGRVVNAFGEPLSYYRYIIKETRNNVVTNKHYIIFRSLLNNNDNCL